VSRQLHCLHEMRLELGYARYRCGSAVSRFSGAQACIFMYLDLWDITFNRIPDRIVYK
jgi:hypothetical protein